MKNRKSSSRTSHFPNYLSRLLSLSLGLSLVLSSCKQKEPIVETDSKFLTPEIMCGTVEFTDGCGGDTDTLNRFGLALLHHMTYEDAAYTFDRVMKIDPDCFWGYWGKAMTYIHPLWPDMISDQDMENGYVLSQKAMSLAKSKKEKLYAGTIAAFYEKSSKSKADRLVDMQTAWQVAHTEIPEDVEAQLFNGLFRLATASPADKTFAVQREVGEMSEGLLVKYPNHPGAYHYAIHAFDVPPLADKAISVARKYGTIAPEISHALHMPSHIFTRVGYWQESIDWNRRSAKASERSPYTDHHAYHASDYMIYAMLQYGEDEPARAIWNNIDKSPDPAAVTPAVAYALAAMPARLELEAHNWEAAAKIPDPDTTAFPWKKWPQYEAMTYMAQGLGAARSKQHAKVDSCTYKIDLMQTYLGESPQVKYWKDQVAVAKAIVFAWGALAKDDKKQALNLMTGAADLEDATTKNPVSPGSLLPARELLGDMYMELGQYADALVAYETSLIRNPNRYNTFLGAAKAAEKLNDHAKAKMYYEKLLALKGETASKRASLEEARKAMTII